MNIAIVLAAGNGSRVGSEIPKQFIEVLGKPILAYTLENFQYDTEIDAIEIVCHENYKKKIYSICRKYGIEKLKWLAIGGETFQQSVLKGLVNLKDAISQNDIVVICFGVSPFCTPDIINDSIRIAREHGNAISAEDVPLCTCIKDDEQGTTQNLLRETIKVFSSPWTFRYGELMEAYEEITSRGLLEELEPHTTSVYLALGKRLWFSKSSGYNFKITVREDLEKFEGLLLLKNKRELEGMRFDFQLVSDGGNK